MGHLKTGYTVGPARAVEERVVRLDVDVDGELALTHERIVLLRANQVMNPARTVPLAPRLTLLLHWQTIPGTLRIVTP